MKKLILLILLIPSLLFAGPLQQAHMAVIGAGSTVAGGTTPDYYWPMDDDAATGVVLADIGGINATLSGRNTEDAQVGDGFDLTDNSSRVYAGIETFLHSSFTMQADFKSVDYTHDSTCWLWDNNLGFSLRYEFGGTSGRMTLYTDGASEGDGSATVDLDTGSWIVVRVIFNAADSTVKLYTGSSESNLTLACSWTSVATPTDPNTYNNTNCGSGWIERVANWKIWKSVVTP